MNPVVLKENIPLWMRTDSLPEKGAPESGVADQTNPEEEEQKLICRECGHPITTDKDRISVKGSHCHVFSNPHGYVFEVGCFSQAPGCLPAGSPSTEFTWFPGHSWQIVICGKCQCLMGWKYLTASGGFNFFGLILPNLKPAT